MLLGNAIDSANTNTDFVTFTFDNVITELREDKKIRINRTQRQDLLKAVLNDPGIKKGKCSEYYIKNIILNLVG